MERNPLKWPIQCISGVLVIFLLSIFTFIAYLLFPGNYSIFTHWVSALGHPIYNPNGDIFFTLGFLFTGLALFLFFGLMYKWYTDETWRKLLLIATQIFGFLTAYSLIMFGLYPGVLIIQHMFWARNFFAFFFIFIILTTISLWTHPDFLKPVAYFAFIPIGIYSIFFFLINIRQSLGINFLLQWLAFLSNFIFIALITYNYFKIAYPS